MPDPIKKHVFSTTFTVPYGFSPVFYSAAYGTMDGEEVEIMVQEDDCAERDGVVFRIAEKIPTFPLLFQGESEHYDSATSRPKWIIDNNKNCWSSSGGWFYLDDNVEAFIYEVRGLGSNEDLKAVREILAIQTEEPEWSDAAREAGWIPPNRVRR